MSEQNSLCTICPRHCGAARQTGQTGFCGMPERLYVSRMAPHMWEEPPISGVRGSGTVFFTGCNLRCVFCQNRTISHGSKGSPITFEQLTDQVLVLQEQGVHNINLVTPTHYTAPLARWLDKVKPHLHIPVVWNSGGYESTDALSMLEGLVDIYLPDFKYISSELSFAYSGAADYALVATEAVKTMFGQVGAVRMGEDGMMQRGLLVRHLVLPGCRKDSMAVLDRLAATLPLSDIRVSIMSQYTPDFAADCPYSNLHRRLTDFEYQSVLTHADKLGVVGYRQGRASAVSTYTPDFNGDL